MSGLTILYHHRTRARDGQSVHIDELIDALRAAGNRIIVVAPKRVGSIATPSVTRVIPKAIYELAEFSYSLVEFVMLTSAALRHRPDALYERANVLMLSGAWTALTLRLPYLLEVNAPLAEERARYSGLAWPWLAAWSERVCWRTASIVLPVSAALASYVEAAGVPPPRIMVTHNGVDVEKFRTRDAAEARSRFGLGSALVLGFVGHIREWHGLDAAIEVLSRPKLAQARMLIVGDGPARPSLEERASQLGVLERVHFAGAVPREALPEITCCIDIALQPNVTRYASPLKLFEYMASGRAIVAPASGNIREVLEHGQDALLFDPGSAQAMTEAIEQLAEDAELRDRLGRAAAEKISKRNMTWRGNADRVASLVRNLRRGRYAVARSPGF